MWGTARMALQVLAIVLIVLALVAVGQSARSIQKSSAKAAATSRSQLLEQMIPPRIAQRVIARTEWPICDHHKEATVMFADIVGFTTRSCGAPPAVVVMMINEFVGAFDEEARHHKVEKIKTIGRAPPSVRGAHMQRTDDCLRACLEAPGRGGQPALGPLRPPPPPSPPSRPPQHYPPTPTPPTPPPPPPPPPITPPPQPPLPPPTALPPTPNPTQYSSVFLCLLLSFNNCTTALNVQVSCCDDQGRLV